MFDWIILFAGIYLIAYKVTQSKDYMALSRDTIKAAEKRTQYDTPDTIIEYTRDDLEDDVPRFFQDMTDQEILETAAPIGNEIVSRLNVDNTHPHFDPLSWADHKLSPQVEDEIYTLL
jgi:hypothetical protein